MSDSVRPSGDLIRVELHDSMHHFGVLLVRLEAAGVECVRYWPGQHVAHVSGSDDAVDQVGVEWDLEGWVEISAANASEPPTSC